MTHPSDFRNAIILASDANQSNAKKRTHLNAAFRCVISRPSDRTYKIEKRAQMAIKRKLAPKIWMKKRWYRNGHSFRDIVFRTVHPYIYNGWYLCCSTTEQSAWPWKRRCCVLAVWEQKSALRFTLRRAMIELMPYHSATIRWYFKSQNDL